VKLDSQQVGDLADEAVQAAQALGDVAVRYADFPTNGKPSRRRELDTELLVCIGTLWITGRSLLHACSEMLGGGALELRVETEHWTGTPPSEPWSDGGDDF